MNLEKIDLRKLILDLRPDLRRKFSKKQADNELALNAWLLVSGAKEYRALHESASYRNWLHQPSQVDGLNEMQRLLWEIRPDVRASFSLPKELDSYIAWYFKHGIGEHELWPFLNDNERRRACEENGPWQNTLRQLANEDAIKSKPSGDWQPKFGVNLIGYVHGQLGIGEDVRMAAHALDSACVPFEMINFRPGDDIPQNDFSMANRVVEHGLYPVNIFCLTAMEHGRFYAERGSEQIKNRYNIGYWPWELSQWPVEWRQLLHLVDEVWVSTKHTLEAVKPHCEAHDPPIPVTLMPMAVQVDVKHRAPQALEKYRLQVRDQWGFAQKACLFCFSFDLNSSINRKNPHAVLESFYRAFPIDQFQRDHVVVIPPGNRGDQK